MQKNTGHLSIKALRQYERVSVEQQKATSKVLTTLMVNCHKHSAVETVTNDCSKQSAGFFPITISTDAQLQMLRSIFNKDNNSQ